MTAKTQSMRVIEADIAAARLLAHLSGKSAAEVMHDALSEYLARHGEEFRRRFATAQRLIRGGDIDGLAELLADQDHDALTLKVAEKHLASLT